MLSAKIVSSSTPEPVYSEHPVKPVSIFKRVPNSWLLTLNAKNCTIFSV